LQDDVLSQTFFIFSIIFLLFFFFILNKLLLVPLKISWILFLSSIIGFMIGYVFKKVYSFLFSMILLNLWLIFETKDIIYLKSLKPVYLFTGLIIINLIFYLIGLIFKSKEDSKRAGLFFLAFSVFLITLIFIYLAFYQSILTINFFNYSPDPPHIFKLQQLKNLFISFELTYLLFLLSGLFLVLVLFISLKKMISLPEFLFIIFLFLFSWIITFISVSNALYKILFTLISAIQIIGILLWGKIKKEEWLIKYGIYLIIIFLSLFLIFNLFLKDIK